MKQAVSFKEHRDIFLPNGRVLQLSNLNIQLSDVPHFFELLSEYIWQTRSLFYYKVSQRTCFHETNLHMSLNPLNYNLFNFGFLKYDRYTICDAIIVYFHEPNIQKLNNKDMLRFLSIYDEFDLDFVFEVPEC